MVGENELIYQYKNGKSDITIAENCFYVALRVTGTGETLRLDEANNFYIDNRRKTEYITQEALDKCGRLPIIVNHPSNNQMLNEHTINDTKIVGQTIASWFDGDEIWALGRIYDKSLIDKLKSTSPGVLGFTDYTINGVAQEGLVEINHLALVDKGHWDMVATQNAIKNNKGAKMEEVKNDTIVEQNVPCEEVKNDADEPKDEAEAKPKDEPKNDADEPKDEAEAKDEPKEAEPKDDADEPKDEAEAKDDAEPDDKGDIKKWAQMSIEGIKHKAGLTSKDAKNDSAEFVDGEALNSDDFERENMLKILRKICDKADARLSVKMPYITDRETPRSVLKKFISLNPALVSKKYVDLMENKLDSVPRGFVSDIMSELEKILAEAENALPKGDESGWIDSGKGYRINRSW